MVSPVFDDAWYGSSIGGRGAEACVKRTPRAPRAKRHGLRAPRLTRDRMEAALLFALLALLLVYLGASLGQCLLRRADPPVINVRVKEGDTLWSLAERYGEPNEYILRRVDGLATRNGLTPGAHLLVGAVLEIPVENPAERQRILARSDDDAAQ